VEIELSHQTGSMGFHCSHTEFQSSGDLFVVCPFRQEPEDLELTSRQSGARIAGLHASATAILS
jgi:hypothetical protein